MIVRLVQEMSGLRDGVPWPARGELVDLPDEEAIRMCENRTAVPVVEETVELAVGPTAESRRREAGLTSPVGVSAGLTRESFVGVPVVQTSESGVDVMSEQVERPAVAAAARRTRTRSPHA